MATDQPRDARPIAKASVLEAFAHHAGLHLDEGERAQLAEYVDTVWEMAAQLRAVDTPGLEGMRHELPLRAAYANREEPGGASAAPAGGDRAGAEPERGGRVDGYRVARGLVHDDRMAGGRAGEDEVPASEALLEAGLVAVAEAIARGRTTPLAVTRAMLVRIDRLDGAVRSYITVDREGAVAAARELTAELDAGPPRSLLHGAPIGAKDNIPIAGMRCTYNSPLTRDWLPRRDAEAVRRLRAAGAVMIGKHNLNEFGWSLPTEEDLNPPPRNPWFPEERSVGSSSGGGAAVAAGLALAALGTDGGGSVRLPACQHGLYGVKPGHDDVPRQGVGGGRLSEVGVLARTAADAAAVLAAMHVDVDAPDAAERLRGEPAVVVARVQEAPTAVRLGIPQAYVREAGLEDDVAVAFDAVRDACRGLGYEPVVLPPEALAILHDAVRANFVVLAAEHYFDHEGPGADRSRYGTSAGFYNLPGACLTAADYLHAVRVGDIARAAIDAALGEVDMLLMPTAPVTRTSTARNPKTHRKGGNAAFTSPFNISGHPSVSFPGGISREGIPMGMQLVGRRGSEFEQLRVGRAIASRLPLPPFPDTDRVAARVRALEGRA
jgi:aspartyl-tRNA(Asn)/glutamyl-tRNA(Gln) amidotransferase subunit A